MFNRTVNDKKLTNIIIKINGKKVNDNNVNFSLKLGSVSVRLFLNHLTLKQLDKLKINCMRGCASQVVLHRN